MANAKLCEQPLPPENQFLRTAHTKCILMPKSSTLSPSPKPAPADLPPPPANWTLLQILIAACWTHLASLSYLLSDFSTCEGWSRHTAIDSRVRRIFKSIPFTEDAFSIFMNYEICFLLAFIPVLSSGIMKYIIFHSKVELPQKAELAGLLLAYIASVKIRQETPPCSAPHFHRLLHPHRRLVLLK